MKRNGKIDKRISRICAVLLLVLGMFGTLLFPVKVHAEGETNKITVDADSLIKDEKGKYDDISLVIDLYQIAGAVKRENVDSYDFTLNEEFAKNAAVKSAFDKLLSLSAATTDDKTAAAAAKDLVDAAALAVKGDSGKLTKVSKTAGKNAPKVTFELTGASKDGIYMILVHDGNGYVFSTAADPEEASKERVVTTAASEANEYKFFPILITLPSRGEAGTISWTSDSEPWQFEASLVLKGSIKPIPPEETTPSTEETTPPEETTSPPEETTPPPSEETTPPPKETTTLPPETTPPVVITGERIHPGTLVTVAIISGAALLVLAIVGLSLRKSEKK